MDSTTRWLTEEIWIKILVRKTARDGKALPWHMPAGILLWAWKVLGFCREEFGACSLCRVGPTDRAIGLISSMLQSPPRALWGKSFASQCSWPAWLTRARVGLWILQITSKQIFMLAGCRRPDDFFKICTQGGQGYPRISSSTSLQLGRILPTKICFPHPVKPRGFLCCTG